MSDVSQSSPSPTPTPVDGGNTYDTLAQRLRETEGLEDSTATWIAENWQKVAGMAVVVVLAVVLVKKFQAENVQAVGRASAAFSVVQKSVTEATTETTVLTEDEAEKLAEKNKRMHVAEEGIAALSSSHDGSVYAQFGDLYEVLLQFRQGNTERAQALLTDVYETRYTGATTFTVPEAAATPQVIHDELAALLQVKLLAADGSAEARLRAEAILKGLVHQGVVTNIEAWVTLVRIADPTTSPREELIALANDLLASRPEFGDLLIREANALGIRVGM